MQPQLTCVLPFQNQYFSTQFQWAKLPLYFLINLMDQYSQNCIHKQLVIDKQYELIMRAKTQFGEYPSLLAAFAPEFKDSHFHIQGRNATPQQTFLSVIQDENYDLHKFLVKVGKGALLGAFITGIFNFTLKIQDSQFKNLRLPSENFRTVWLKIRSNTIYGAVCGAAWFFIYDKIFCPHGQSTLRRYLAAHSVGGALFLATFYHPAAIVYGGVLGLALGVFKVQKNRLSLPQNFRVQIATVSEQQKFQSRINQIEEQLSSSPKLYDNRHTKLLI